jgi:hypothetical protein
MRHRFGPVAEIERRLRFIHGIIRDESFFHRQVAKSAKVSEPEKTFLPSSLAAWRSNPLL